MLSFDLKNKKGNKHNLKQNEKVNADHNMPKDEHLIRKVNV